MLENMLQHHIYSRKSRAFMRASAIYGNPLKEHAQWRFDLIRYFKDKIRLNGTTV